LDAAQAAIVDETGAVLSALSEPMSRGQAERIAPMVQEAARGAGIALKQVSRVAVTVGPGSFTGLRVGLAFARAAALAIGAPCVGVNTLEALALEQGEDGLSAARIDTQGASFAALYENGRAVLAPAAFERDDVDAALQDAAQGRAFALRSNDTPLDIAAFARRALRLDPAAYPARPLYLRAPLKSMPAP